MPQTNYTPILIYASSTTGNTPAAGNLTNSAGGAELAINYFDGRLFYKDASNVVQVLATKGTGTIGGSNTQVQFNSSGALAGSSNMTFNGTTLSVNGLTVTNNPTFNGGTANGVLYLDGSKVVTSGTALTFNGTNLSLTAAGGAYFYTPNVVNGGGIFDAGGNNGMLIFGNVGGSTLRFLASGAEQMRLNSTGLGIGTNNPGQKLHVAGASQYDGTLFGGSAAANTLTLKSTSGNANRSGISVGEVIASDNGGITFNVAGSSVETLAMRIQGISGNVGIGTNNPTQKLDVNGSAVGSNFYIRPGSAGTYGLADLSAAIQTYSGSVSPANAVLFLTNAAERMRLDASGNLGLGVTPGAWQANFRAIQMFGSGISLMSGLNAMYIMNNTIYDGSFKYVNSAQATSYIQAAGAHQWLTAPSGTAGNTISFTQAMTLDSGGNLLLGQTSDAFTSANRVVLGINGATDSSITLRAGGTLQGFLLGGASQFVIGSNALPIVFQRSSGGTESMRIDASGNLGIGTNNPGTKLDVQGVIPFIRLKENTTGYLGVRGENASGNFYFGIDNAAGSFYGSAYGRVLYADGAFPMVFYTNATERMRLDASGNLGLGVTPSAWFTSNNFRAIQLTNSASVHGQLAGGAFLTGISSNWFASAAGTDTYIANGFATTYRQLNGQHAWYTAPSGTAGNAISFTQAMTLDANGNLAIGVTSTTARLEVYQAANNLVRIGSAATSTAGISIAANGNTHGTTGAQIFQDSGNSLNVYTNAANSVVFGTNNTIRAFIDGNGNVVAGNAAITTNATNGFLYVPTCAGTPTGTPTTYTGRSPIVVDTTNNKLYFYSGGAWRDAGP